MCGDAWPAAREEAALASCVSERRDASLAHARGRGHMAVCSVGVIVVCGKGLRPSVTPDTTLVPLSLSFFLSLPPSQAGHT